MIKCGLRDGRLGQACIAEADSLLRNLNVSDEDRASLVIEVAELLEERAKQLARTIETTLREVELDEYELDEYCPSCASKLYESDEGKVCGRCCLVYKIKKAEIE